MLTFNGIVRARFLLSVAPGRMKIALGRGQEAHIAQIVGVQIGSAVHEGLPNADVMLIVTTLMVNWYSLEKVFIITIDAPGIASPE